MDSVIIKGKHGYDDTRFVFEKDRIDVRNDSGDMSLMPIFVWEIDDYIKALLKARKHYEKLR